MVSFFKRHWFLTGLLGVFIVTMVDTSGVISGMGRWLKNHYGPQIVIISIFFLSGCLLDARRIRGGLSELKGTLLALLLIFVISPLISSLVALAPFDHGLVIGLFIVAVMPTTLSSGVVMTSAAGGNMAHALFTTILANALAVITIPLTLSLLIQGLAPATAVKIDAGRIMFTLGCYVIVPLFAGMLAKQIASVRVLRFVPLIQTINQCLVLLIVWMGLTLLLIWLVANNSLALDIVLTGAVLAAVLAAAFALPHSLGMGKGRRESVIFMGGQKTLPLSIIIQVSLFPQYGQALVFCVIHHVVHLLMDGYLVGRLKKR